MATARQLAGLSRWPVAVAPMAGGPSTVALVVAAVQAGTVGFLAGGYQSAAALATEIQAVRAATAGAFGVNLFLPGQPAEDPAALAAYVKSLEGEAQSLGTATGAPAWDDDAYGSKLDVLLAGPPALVSFTFGCPDAAVVQALQAGGALVAISVTTPEEAALALRVGPDCLCVQGAEAGAHRGHFANDDRPDQDRPLYALLAQVRRQTLVPLIAAGGISGPDDVVWALAAGATMVQVGTAFLRCTESGAHPIAQAALVDARFTDTGITRAFSGRRARGLSNDWMRQRPHAPAAYPEINNATRPLRAAAAAAGDPDHMSLYAGTGFRQAGTGSAAEIVAHLVAGLPS